MKNNIFVLMGLSLIASTSLSTTAHASTLNCTSYYEQNGERVLVQIDLNQITSRIESGKLKVISSPISNASGMIPVKGETASLTRESLPNRILLSGKSSLSSRVGPGYSRAYYVNISDTEFKKSKGMTIGIQAGLASAVSGPGILTAMQFTCQKI